MFIHCFYTLDKDIIITIIIETGTTRFKSIKVETQICICNRNR